MKSHFNRIGLAHLCEWFGITRQAYYKTFRVVSESVLEEDFILKEVFKIRKLHPRMGCRKLYKKLSLFMEEHQIKMGRDSLFKLLYANNLLIRKRKNKVITTRSFEWMRKYPNLIKEFKPNRPNQLWVSDITYWKISGTYVYISLVTDAFSHKIVGSHAAKTLESSETIKALKIALANLPKEEVFNLIHHSDRGSQYCQHDYVKLLQKHKIQVSMTEKGDPLENAIAERVNGIIKDEYLYDYKVNSLSEAKTVLEFAVGLYNNDRPHNSIGNLYPSQIHDQKIITEKLWKNYYNKPIVKEVIMT